jgi:ABC-2 type transport system permease protein
MSPRILVATTLRVLLQLRHDPRTIALILVVPTGILALLAWILSEQPGVFDEWGALLLGVFPLIVMFLITSVATLRERSSGTLERLLALPMHKSDFLLGYGLAFGLAAGVQAVVVSLVTFGLLGLDIAGPVWAATVVAVVVAVLGSSLGLFVSAFAATEFQAVQFMPALIIPQLLLCGLIGPRDTLPRPLELVSDVLPLSYAVDAMRTLTTSSQLTADFWWDVAVVGAFVLGALVLGSATLRRRTA